MGHVVIARGISGSGKSTFCTDKYPNAPRASADDFFINDDGEYVFDPEKKREAHPWCLSRFLDMAWNMSIEPKHPQIIVVDNTNLRIAEIAPYYSVAESLKHSVEIVTIWADPDEAAARNQHGLTEDLVHRQFRTLLEEGSRFPPWWNHRIWCAPDFHQKMSNMGADYERFLSIVQSAGIPYKTDKSAEWIVLEKKTKQGLFAGEIIFYFDTDGKMMSQGWVIPDKE